MKIPDSRTLPLAAALVALTMAPAASAATPVYREIKDWVVACDNTTRCEAIGMQEAYPQIILRLVVDAGPSGEPELSLESEAPVAARDLRLDGARFAASSLLQPATGDEGVQRIGHDGAQVLPSSTRSAPAPTCGQASARTLPPPRLPACPPPCC